MLTWMIGTGSGIHYNIIVWIDAQLYEIQSACKLWYLLLHTNYVDLSGDVRMHSADGISIRVQGRILSELSGSRFITMRVAYESYYHDEINSLITDENIW